MSRPQLLRLVIAVILLMLFLIGCESTAPAPVAEAPAATDTPAPSADTPIPEAEAQAATSTLVPPTPTSELPTAAPTPEPPEVSPLPPLTKLYLSGSGLVVVCKRDGGLSEEKPAGFEMSVTFFAAGKMSECTVDGVAAPLDIWSFDYRLDDDIPGGLYEIVLNLAAAKEGNESKFEVSIVLEHQDTSTVLGQTTVTATSAEFKRFTTSVVGADPEAQAEDRLILVVKNISSEEGSKILYGSNSEAIGYVEVPW